MNRIKFDSLIREIDEKNNPLYLEVYKYHADVNQLYGDLPYSFHLNMVKNIVNQYSSYNFGKETPPFRMGRNCQFPL